MNSHGGSEAVLSAPSVRNISGNQRIDFWRGMYIFGMAVSHMLSHPRVFLVGFVTSDPGAQLCSREVRGDFRALGEDGSKPPPAR